MQVKSVVLKGLQIARDIPYRDPAAAFSIAGTDGMGRGAFLPVGDELLSRHILMLGGVGTGKSNLLFHLLRNLRAHLKKDDLLLVMDTTGELLSKFYQKGDEVFSGDARDPGQGCWNLFLELKDSDDPVRDATSLVDALFSKRLQTALNPVYEKAAADLMMALIVYLLGQGADTLESNLTLRELIEGFDAESMLTLLGSQPELRGFGAYLTDPTLAAGVASSLQQAARELFSGRYGSQGQLSIKKLVRERDAKAVFLRYNAQNGAAQGAVLSALIGLALKEAIHQRKEQGQVYLVLDEPRVLPCLPIMEDAMLLGRESGVRVIACAGSVGQLRALAPANDKDAVLRAFGTTAAFRLIQRDSRDYVKALYGRRRVVESYLSGVQARGVVEQVMDQFTIEDDDLTTLQTGECIFCTMGFAPFLFKTKKYGV